MEPGGGRGGRGVRALCTPPPACTLAARPAPSTPPARGSTRPEAPPWVPTWAVPSTSAALPGKMDATTGPASAPPRSGSENVIPTPLPSCSCRAAAEMRGPSPAGSGISRSRAGVLLADMPGTAQHTARLRPRRSSFLASYKLHWELSPTKGVIG